MLKSLVLVLFVAAWAVVAFAIIRGLVVAWGFDRRIAFATAIAVAGAFALGAVSPFALSTLQPGSTASSVAVTPVPVPLPPAIARAVKCPANARIGTKSATGDVDVVTPDKGAGANNSGVVEVPAGVPLLFSGWVALAAGPASSICATVDGRLVAAQLMYNLPRADVAATLGQPADIASGFGVTLRLPPGKHIVDIGLVEPDGRTVELIKVPMTLQVH